VLILRTIEAFKRQLAISGSLTPNLVREMAEAVPDRLLADIVADSRRGVTPPSSLASTPNAAPAEPKKGSGWQEHVGFPDRSRQFELMDRIVESQVGGPNDTRKLR
jgi:hypothetical protein